MVLGGVAIDPKTVLATVIELMPAPCRRRHQVQWEVGTPTGWLGSERDAHEAGGGVRVSRGIGVEGD